ncbi:MAG: DUF4097 domain-containing protein [Clostridiales bacterium]|jgi:hypothetical protein|nr:DUF4097 domain-containing protein [Clostridiales bacterium]
MDNPKMEILKLLRDGKITAEEASERLGGNENCGAASLSKRTDFPGNAQTGQTAQMPPAAPPRDYAGELSKKFENFTRGMEPKIYKLAESVAGGAERLSEKISRTIASSGASAAYPEKAPAGFQEALFEYAVDAGAWSELSISSLRGGITVKGYNGDKISAGVRYRLKNPAAAIQLVKLGGKYYLDYDEDGFDFVEVSAFVPERAFKNVFVSAVNGDISVSGLSCEFFTVRGQSAPAQVSEVSAGNFTAEMADAPLKLRSVRADSARVENTNGSILAELLDVRALSATALNGAVSVLGADFNKFAEYLWDLSSSNGKLSLNLPTMPGLGYHIKGHATFGKISVGLSGVRLTRNEADYVELMSDGFDRAEKKARFSLEVSNAGITIN